MYEKAFWNRVNVQQICEFIKYGAEKKEEKHGSYEDRYKQYNKNFTAGIHSYRDEILLFEWEGMDDKEKNLKCEDLYSKIMESDGELSDLSFEVGFVVGLQIGQQLNNSLT